MRNSQLSGINFNTGKDIIDDIRRFIAENDFIDIPSSDEIQEKSRNIIKTIVYKLWEYLKIKNGDAWKSRRSRQPLLPAIQVVERMPALIDDVSLALFRDSLGRTPLPLAALHRGDPAPLACQDFFFHFPETAFYTLENALVFPSIGIAIDANGPFFDAVMPMSMGCNVKEFATTFINQIIQMANPGSILTIEDEMMFVIDQYTVTNNFFHFMIHSLPPAVATRRYGVPQAVTCFPGYARFKTSSATILARPGDMLYADASVFFTRKAILPGYFPVELFIRPEVPPLLAEAFGQQHVPCRQPRRRLYVKRDARNDLRAILNEEEIEGILREKGFETFLPHTVPIDQQAAMFAEADIIVAVNGAALANLAFARNVRLIEISPDAWGTSYIWSMMNALGGIYSPLILPRECSVSGGLFVAPQRLRHLLHLHGL